MWKNVSGAHQCAPETAADAHPDRFVDRTGAHREESELPFLRQSEACPAAAEDKELVRDTGLVPEIDNAHPDVPAAHRGHGPEDAPTPRSRSGLGHGSDLSREIGLLDLDAFAKGVAGETTHFDVLADLAGGLLHKLGNGE